MVEIIFYFILIVNLGPLLFLLFVNDLCQELKCDKLLYADDMKIFNNIYSEDDCILLRDDLERVNQWCQSNRLES